MNVSRKPSSLKRAESNAVRNALRLVHITDRLWLAVMVTKNLGKKVCGLIQLFPEDGIENWPGRTRKPGGLVGVGMLDAARGGCGSCVL